MKKLLIIDDEVPTLSMLKLFLGTLGYTVLTAEKVDDGIEIFKEEKPCIVLTDIKMPGKDGFSALSSIKSIDPAAEVIVITGHGDKDLARKAFDLNASDFLHKPLDTEALEKALRKVENRLEERSERV